MLRGWNLFYIVVFLLSLFSGAGSALAGTDFGGNHEEAGPSAEHYTRLGTSKAEADQLRQEAADREAANAIAVQGFRFSERDCRLPQLPTDNETRKMKRNELSAVADKIKDFGRCVDQAKVIEYEAVKDLIVNRLGGSYKESGNKITFHVTSNVSKEVVRLFAQVNEAYVSGFSSFEVANARYNQSVHVWNTNQKFIAEFELKINDQGASTLNQ